jgi:predicted porin
MKKSLLALAVFGAFAGAASAQTNVTIYGVVDAGITRESGAPAGGAWKLATGVQSGNRIGFKGSEDLGAGLKANFTLENGFDADTGALRQGNRLFGRQAWVGLSSNSFGAVNFGRQYDPLFVAVDSIDPFGTGLAGHLDTIFNVANVRTDNAITYSAPALGGFTFNALYGFGEVAGSTSANRTFGLSVGYANGPVNVILAHNNVNNAASAKLAKLTFLGGTYDFGVAKLHLAYETEKADVGANTDRRDWMVGATAPIGAGSVFATYARTDDRTAANADAKLYAIGYTYALSKRTNFYTAYGHVTNDNGATYYVGDASSGGIPAAAGGPNTSGFNVGIRHKF